MSELPSILVTNGWKADRNHKLTEIVIPSTVKTLSAPTKVTFMGTTLNSIPSTSGVLQTFVAPNITVLSNTAQSGGKFKGWTSLKEVTMNGLLTLSESGGGAGGTFSGCTSLQTVNMISLLTIDNAKNGGEFYGCTSLQTVNMPNLTTIIHNGNNGSGGPFQGCTSLTTINFPKLQSTTTVSTSGGVFYNCTSLLNVTLGSAGNPVSALGTYTFAGCTQSGLTITIYTEGGASLPGEKWGATNATIVYETA